MKIFDYVAPKDLLKTHQEAPWLKNIVSLEAQNQSFEQFLLHV
jgi:hypothetical protein